jgi:exopolysaccharide biosynthesis polyprenyl glycosylphosphotransferase
MSEKNPLLFKLEEFLDLFLTITAFVAAYFFKRDFAPMGFRGLDSGHNYYLILLLVIIFWYMSFALFYGYSSYRTTTLGIIVTKVFKAVLAGFLFLTLAMYLLKISDVSRGMLLVFIALDIVLLISSKAFVYNFLKSIREKGYNYRSVVLIGTRERAKDVLGVIWKRHGSGYRILGCLDTERELVGKEVVPGIRVLDTVNRLESVLRKNVVDELIFAMPVKLIENASKLMALAENMGVSVRIIPDWQLHSMMYEPAMAKVHFENFLDIPTMALHTAAPSMGAMLFKNFFDYVVSAALLLVTSPFFLMTAIAIKVSSKGPVFYSQDRVSVHGRSFKLYKFRTMVENAESLLDGLKKFNESDGPVFKIARDPRIIPYIGTFLRRSGLDELPQLINVIKGEMSLIGPRPPIPSEVDKYEIWQRRRLSMKPGMSCTWQVAPHRNDISFDGWMRMDLDYIDNWSLWLDCKILFLTVRAVIFGTGR